MKKLNKLNQNINRFNIYQLKMKMRYNDLKLIQII